MTIKKLSSKDKMIKALFKLMHTEQYNDISITQITQEAGLSRKTFYRLFKKKEDLINKYFDIQFENMIKTIQAENIHDYWRAVELYFDYWKNKKKFILFLKKHQILYLFSDYVSNRASDFFKVIRGEDTFDLYQPILKYLLSYSVCGMHFMMIKWIENNMEIDSHEIISKLKLGMKMAKI